MSEPISHNYNKIYKSLEEAEEAKRDFEAYDIAHPPRNEEYEYRIAKVGAAPDCTGSYVVCYRIEQNPKGHGALYGTPNISSPVIGNEVPGEKPITGPPQSIKYDESIKYKVYESEEKAEEVKCAFEAYDAAHPPRDKEYEYHIGRAVAMDPLTRVARVGYRITQFEKSVTK